MIKHNITRYYIRLSITLDSQRAELLADELLNENAISVSFEDAKDSPIFQLQPNEHPLWDEVKLHALFSNDASEEKIIQLLKTFFNSTNIPPYQFEKVEEQDWVRATQRQFNPQSFGPNLWICPSWCDEKTLSGIIVKIDPGVAFGTGTHPTTGLCLTWLANHPPIDKIVMDYGCGSGILALSALALGAKKVYAIDHDSQAIEATKNNAIKNNFGRDKLEVLLPSELSNTPVDLILANILANPIIELATRFSDLLKPNGQLILSGILENEIEKVVSAYQPCFTIESREISDGWAMLWLRK